ncbi:MAG TPA: glutamate cyclase domain-containing protein [Pirellulales bacterium]|nr:glutamate cyclase domain-containing protein [Pirellulales bacterium]
MAVDFSALEEAIRQDPGGRGIAGYRHAGRFLAEGMLERAARDLADRADAVLIVTGFCIADTDPVVAETDGPPGALYLARALAELGLRVTLASDGSALALLRLGRRLWHLDVDVIELPTQAVEAGDSIDDWLPPSLAQSLTHLISIERVGPSHTLDSLTAQSGNSPAASARFDMEVPLEHRDCCHNMRGVKIDAYTAPAHRWFEAARAGDRRIHTISVGDGGNEIGMGAIPWEALRAALPAEWSGRIICRVASDDLIVAGVSNWGGYALACAVASLRGRRDLIAHWDEARQRELIETLVSEGGAVDGVTRRREATVDGLPIDLYLGVLERIRHLC